MSRLKARNTFFIVTQRIVLLLIIGYISFGALLYGKQRSMIYHPTPEISLSDYQSIHIKNDGISIKVWNIHSDKKRAVIFFGGNADAVECYIPIFDKLLPNHSVYFVNYRGYGGTGGEPSEQALFSDAIAVYDVVKQHSPHISVIGRSLGTGVASFLASKKQVKHLILITPFDSILNIAQDMFPFYPMSILLKDKFSSIEWAANIKANVFMMVADQDHTVPPKHARRLAASFKPEQVTVQWWHDAGHVNISHQQGFYEAIKQFLTSTKVEGSKPLSPES